MGYQRALSILRRACRWFFPAVLTLFCVSLSFTGCSVATEQEEQEERPPVTVTASEPSSITVSSIPGLSLVLEETEYSGPDVSVRYALQNETELIYWYGPLSTWMEVFQEGEWHRLAPRTDVATAITADAFGVRPNAGTETLHFSTKSFFHYGDIVPPGTYRLVIGVGTDEEPAVEEYLAAEFDVTE